MDKRSSKLKIDGIKVLLSTPNELHKQHRLNASGTGAHRSKKCYSRKKNKQDLRKCVDDAFWP